jgi:hypothetical protein
VNALIGFFAPSDSFVMSFLPFIRLGSIRGPIAKKQTSLVVL